MMDIENPLIFLLRLGLFPYAIENHAEEPAHAFLLDILVSQHLQFFLHWAQTLRMGW